MKRTIVLFLLGALMLNTGISAKKITLEDIYKKGTFGANSVYGISSMNDGLHYTTNEKGMSIEKWSYNTGTKTETIFSIEELTDAPFKRISDYEFSDDETKILLTTNMEAIYRHSFKAAYYVWDLKTKKLQEVSENGKQQLAAFSPDGSKVAFVRDNNIYITELITGNEYAITDDGKWNHIINGAPDWVYEEEFGFSRGFHWSPRGDKIAYYKFDESEVREFSMAMYGALYPEPYTFKYPKAGEKNSVVSIHVYHLHSKETKTMDVGSEKDQYISRIKWTANNDELAMIRLNRLQNKVDLLVANAETGKSKVAYTETNKYYISETSDNFVTFLNDNKQFIIMSEQDGFMHFYLYNMNGELVNQITQGNWDVATFYGFDEKSKTLYYSSYETSTVNMDVYSIKLNGKGKKRLTPNTGWNRASFSNNFNYFINYYSNANTPTVVTLYDKKGNEIRVLEDNAKLKETIAEYDFGKKEVFTVTTSKGVELNAYMIKPADFDENKEYPLFIYVYGGPESQNVTDSWGHRDAWFQYLAQEGYIVACVDNRGTNGKGEEFRKATYMQLGKLELEDQTEAAKYFGSLDYIDDERIGIFGWSYGGYMSSLCLFRSPEVYKMAISVAPVTSWRYYDTIYTERFMRTPQENPDGYDAFSPIMNVDGLEGKLLLMHGSADDNVHYQNTMEMVNKLVSANKQFDMFIYPNRNHGIYGDNATFHIYTKMTNYIKDNL